MADGEVRVEITGDSSDLKKNLADSKTSVNAAASQMNNLESSIKSTNKSAEDVADNMEDFADTIAEASKDTENIADDMENFADETKKASQEVMTFGDLLKSNVFGNLLADGLQAAGGAVADFVKDGVELASNLQEVQNVVDTTFGAGATQIYEWSNAAAESFGMSSLSAQKFNGTLGAMLKSMGITDEAVMKMSTDMVGLAGDMASFYNLDIEQAFDKIRAGISGETEPLKQLGINMSVANLEAYALANGIETAYEKMSQAEQAQLRYNYLMSVTADAQGDFAKTSDSYANQQRILQLNIENLSATIGQSLLPVLNETITLVNDKLPEAGPAIEKLGESLGGMLEFVIDNHEAILALGGGIGTYTVATKAATTAQTLFNVAAKANPYVLIGSAAAIAVVGLVSFADSISDIGDRYIETAEKSQKAAAQQQETVSSLESELEGINKQIDEINRKGALSITDAEELANLELENAKLSTQLEIEKEILKVKQAQAQEDTYNALSGGNTAVGSVTYVEDQFEQYKYWEEKAKEQRDLLAEAIAENDEVGIDTFGKQANYYEEMALKYKLGTLEGVQAMDELAKSLDKTSEAGQEALGYVDNAKNAVLDYFGILSEPPKIDENIVSNAIVNPSKIWAENQIKALEDKAKSGDKETENIFNTKINDIFSEKWEKLEHDYAVGSINTESELYAKKRELWNKYGDETNKDHWKYYEDLIKYDKDYAAEQAKISEEAAKKEAKAFEKQYEKQKDIVNEGLSDIIEEHEKAYDAIAKKREEYSKKLMSIGGDLFTVDVSEDENGKEVTTYTVNNLEEQLRKMREYHRQITELKKQGASEELLSEINSLGAEESSQFAKYLSSMSDAEFAEINRLYNEKQALADELSADLYKSEAQAISDSMTTALAELANNSGDYGIQAADSYVDAFISEFDERYEEIAALLENTNIGAEILATVEAETAYYSSKALAGTTYKEEAPSAVNVGGKLDVERLVEGINKTIQIVLDGKVIAESTMKYEGQYQKQTGG